jgi:RND family efflux transporter MFP subunit
MKMINKPLCALGLIALAAGLSVPACNSTPPRAEPPPPKVMVAKPVVRPLADFDQYNGWLAAVDNVEVRARVRGHINKVHFTDGDLVKKGQLLFELDPRPFQSDIDRATEQVKIYEAQLVAASKEEARLTELVKKGGASQSQVDAAVAQTKSLEAQVESSKQEVIRRGYDLEYSRITAPIDGRIGRAQLTAGNLVNAGGSDPVLTTIVSVDPINIYFDVDERSLLKYMRQRDKSQTAPGNVSQR